MKNKIFSFIILFCGTLIHLSSSYEERNVLWSEYTNKTKSFIDINIWRKDLRQEFIDILSKLPLDIRNAIIKRADNEVNTSWPSLLVWDQLEYTRDGDRMRYQGFFNNRRKRLMDLIIGELISESGKYLNQIANGVWLLLEESSWIWPAHLYLQDAGLGLPDPDQVIIDLGVGQSSAYIAWTHFLLGENLTKISPMITKRIEYELNARLVRPFLDTSLPWMGFNGPEFWKWNVGNNWNTWINSNILMTSLLSLNDTTRNDVIRRSVLSTDIFVNRFPNDGGDNEGPHYWSAAAGRLIQFISLLSSVSANQMNWSSNELLRKSGEYIYKLHIDSDYFFNYNDANAREIPDPSVVLQFGKIFNDQTMKEFAAYLYKLAGSGASSLSRVQNGELNQIYIQLSANELLQNITPKAPQPIESWFPDLQVITLRTEEGTAKGIFLGAKAGFNGDSQHNHNDVGNFVLYINGLPAIIDVGVATYTIATFSDDRYNIWNMQSQWHNTPTINGVQQQAGTQFSARNVKYKKLKTGGEFEADIAGAYPKEAEVKSWIRKLTFDRTVNIVNLSETYSLSKFVKPFKIHFITILNETQTTNGEIVLNNQNTRLDMHFDSDLFTVETDKHEVDDLQLVNAWGHTVNRVSLVSKVNTLEGQFTISFELK